MKCVKMSIYLVLAMTLVTGSMALAQGRMMGNRGGGLCTSVDYLPYEALSEDETAAIIYMREEEKLARDVYQAMYEKWNSWVFDRISQSEQQHMDALGSLIAKYNLEDPVADNARGVFTNPDLKTLYDQLVEAGNVSATAAFQVGATIEDLDIFDLKERLEKADNQDVKTVFQNLMKGSRNHLRSFVYQLSLEGESYEAQYLTSEEIQEIVTSPRERGPVDENGEPVLRQGRGRTFSSRSLSGNLLAKGRNGSGNGPQDGTGQQRGHGGSGGTGPRDGSGYGSSQVSA